VAEGRSASLCSGMPGSRVSAGWTCEALGPCEHLRCRRSRLFITLPGYPDAYVGLLYSAGSPADPVLPRPGAALVCLLDTGGALVGARGGDQTLGRHAENSLGPLNLPEPLGPPAAGSSSPACGSHSRTCSGSGRGLLRDLAQPDPGGGPRAAGRFDPGADSYTARGRRGRLRPGIRISSARDGSSPAIRAWCPARCCTARSFTRAPARTGQAARSTMARAEC